MSADAEHRNVCRICRQPKPLTQDHVPPRAWTGGHPMRRQDIIDHLTNPKGVRNLIKQDGIKFKTICGECNSKIGSEFDPELIKYAQFVTMARGTLPRSYKLSFQLRSSRIIRAVLGHLASATQQTYFSTFDDLVTEYLFDKSRLLPDNVHIYHWIHPATASVIMRDTAIGWLGKNDPEPVFSHILKFYPVGFLVTMNGKIPDRLNIPELFDPGYSETVSMGLPPLIENTSWPEHPGDTHFLLGGEAFHKGTYATPRK